MAIFLQFVKYNYLLTLKLETTLEKKLANVLYGVILYTFLFVINKIRSYYLLMWLNFQRDVDNNIISKFNEHLPPPSRELITLLSFEQFSLSNFYY